MSDEDQARNAFETRTRALFDDSVERLDARTRSRLNQARQAALAELERPARWRWQVWAPAGALAAAAVVAVVLRVGPEADGPAVPVAASPAMTFDDLDLVAGAEDLDMLDEDPEFYAWAAGSGDMG